MSETNIRIKFEDRELVALRRLAKKHGYILSTSRLHGAGNIKAMLKAVANDELIIVVPVKAGDNGN